jgi:hypothetical protein
MIARKALYHLNHSTSPGESIKLKNEGRQKTHEKRLTIPGHKGNANQNHTKIPSYPVRIAIIKNSTNNRCWRGCGGKRNPFTLLVGMQTGATTLEKNLEAS